jgi:FkbM family methyltransferase
MNSFSHLRHQIQNLGLLPTVRYKIQRRTRTRSYDTEGDFSLTTKHSAHPLFCRPNATDLFVFDQIFVERDYGCLDIVEDADFILDCGANVGYTSAYMLTNFPNAELVAIEPDPSNFRVLEKNLRQFGDRVQCRQAAIWSRPTRIKLDEDKLGDGNEWARTVSETEDNGAQSLPAVDIATLLEESGHDRISILKMDIEGAERVVFAENYESWIDRVDNIVIELHGPDAEEIFWSAVPRERFDVSRSGELTVCLNPA